MHYRDMSRLDINDLWRMSDQYREEEEWYIEKWEERQAKEKIDRRSRRLKNIKRLKALKTLNKEIRIYNIDDDIPF